MSCPAIAIQGKDLVFTVQFHDGTGVPCDATGSVNYSIYEAETAAPILTGTMAKFASQTGFYSKTLACTIANGFEKFKTYTIRIAATVAGVSVTQVFSFLCLGSEDVAGIGTTGLICTLEDVKDRLGITKDEHDAVISRIITSLEEIFNAYTRRKLIITESDVTEYYSPEGNCMQLERYPVVGISSIKQALDYDFDNVDAMTVNEAYRLLKKGKNGIVRFILKLVETPDSVQVVYRGGFCPAGQTPGESEFAMPADLREAAIEQATFIFKRRDDIGLSGIGMQGGSISKFSDMELLPLVKQVLDNYKRPSL